METLELPESVFSELEAYRRAKKLSQAEAVSELLARVGFADEWQRRKPTPAAAHLSDEDIERLAVEGVREARRTRRE